jgi:hypothetical protein
VLSREKDQNELVRTAFAGEALRALIGERYVLDVVDLPEPKADNADPGRLIVRLIYEYNAVYLPFLLALDTEGRSYWAAPLDRYDPEALALMMKRAQRNRLGRDYYLMEAELSDDGTKRAHMLSNALTVVGTTSPVSGYGEVIKRIVEEHPKDDCILPGHFRAVLGVEAIKDALIRGEFDKMDALLDAFLKDNQGTSPALAQRALFFGGHSLIERGHYDDAAKVFERAIVLAPNTTSAFIMGKCIEQIRVLKQGAEPKEQDPEGDQDGNQEPEKAEEDGI